MIRAILIVVVIVIAAVLVFAATRPNEFQVQRAMTIKAPPDKIFALINDFHEWAAWSPYEKLDPSMTRTFSGSTSGKGAIYAWQSKGKAGVGSMEIADTTPPSSVTLNLDFTKPFKAHNVVTFTLEPQGDSTNVTWAMAGASPYVAKVMGVFVDMDRLVGGDFETGLANLKTLAEK